LGEVSQLNNADLTFAALQGLKMALLYGPAAFRKRDCAWKAEVADMYPACLIGSRAVALMGIRTHLWSHYRTG
jgi:hypothetical protein